MDFERIFKLHKDAEAVLRAAEDMQGRKESLERSLDQWDWYPDQREELENSIDTCARSVKKLLESYKRLLTKIIEA